MKPREFMSIVTPVVISILVIFQRACADRSHWESLMGNNNLFGPDTSMDNSLAFHTGSRPSPSDELPILDLEENPDTALDPKEKDLEYRTLRRLLGNSYDKNFMSVPRPLETYWLPNGTVDYKQRKGRPSGRRPAFLKYFGKYFRVGNELVQLKVSRRIKHKLKKYIWNYTHCPVHHTWKDLGIRFWPRWFKEAQCYKGKSCSIPPGMSCRPDASTTKTILRWHCQGWQRNSNCRWIHIHYPVITKCACQC